MKRFVILTSVLLISSGCVTRQCHKKDERAVATTKALSFEDMAKASNVIMQTFDSTSNICSIPSDQVFSLPQKWQAVVDERFREEKNVFLSKTEAERDEFGPQDCTKDCSCAIYSSFYDFLDQEGVALSSRSQDRMSKVAKAASELNLNDPRCIQEAEWFCSSKVLEKLLQE